VLGKARIVQPNYITRANPAQADLGSRVIVDLAEAHQFFPLVNRSNLSDRPTVGTHHQAVSRGARPAVLDPLQELAIGDPGRGEKDVFPCYQVVNPQAPVGLIPLPAAQLGLFRRSGLKPGLNLASHALERTGGEYPFGRAANPDQYVDS